ncbi:hypothetical protein KUTeg_012432 [Tegillarca granosa]|uniref:C2 DOCK-type domain-containing protein n=1 Tax=Tegillarca granosa TaxID=220873 RepID=A0ABQ9EZH0_TEGGR|nr:hypothetical protein KUTeg_012432 [Tegillarca granosa]
MAERKFRQRIQKIGAAAKVREEVAQQMRENIILQRPPSVDPVDYETYVTKNKTILHNDPQREMLVFPHDDIVNPPPTLAKKLRTLYSTVPKSAEHEATSLLVQECIKSYTDCCKKIKFKYSLYSGGYLSLPSLKNAEPLPHQVFEIDTEADEKEEEALSKSNVTSITKTGWLYKGPDSGKENIMSFTRQFKRRYFVLKQQSDFTYILEFYKDERKFEAKGSLFLDVAKEVVKSTKKGKYCFEVHVHDRAPYVFAAEKETSTPDKMEGKADNSMHPELQKKFAIDEDIDSSDDEEICVFPREFGERFMLQLHDFKMKLQVDLSEEKIANKCCNPEPFFLTFALYDAKEGRKISEDFHMDPNEPEIRSMIPPEVLHASDKLHTVEGRDTAPQLNGLKDSWILSPNRQIEKVLQGPMLQALEPYSKADSSKSGSKLISPSQGPAELPIYRHDGTKLSTADIIKHLQDFRKPDKQSKLQEIPDPPPDPPALEIEEFVGDKGSLCDTFDSYINNIYIYPVSLKYEHQKSFAKARNIACCIEIKDSDEDGSLPLKRIYGRPEVGVYTTVASTTVLHHVTSPDFTEEVKISLPTQIHDRHHVLFRFYHVSCEGSKSSLRSSSSSGKKKDTIETPIGYAWLPLLNNGRVIVGEHTIPVAANLPPGYLSHDVYSQGRGAGGPEIKWVDGGKHLFKVNSFLRSTIYTKEQHLHNFFYHCQRIENSPVNDLESVNRLKVSQVILFNSLHAVDVSTYIQFLPTILNQLFKLLGKTSCDDVAINAVKVLIHIVSEVSREDKSQVVKNYVKYMFKPDPVPKGSKQKTVHEELAKNLTSILRPATADHVVVEKFLTHSWFFFEILIKSMTLYLIDSERIKMPRNERFPGDYQYRIQTLLQTLIPNITQKHKELPRQTKIANHSLAYFVKMAFTLMDRGFVFKEIAAYMENFGPGDPTTLHEFKFEFLQIVCSHEHFVPLSLPLMRRGMIKTFKDLKCDYTLSEEYREKHYLAGLLLQELKIALNEPHDLNNPPAPGQKTSQPRVESHPGTPQTSHKTVSFETPQRDSKVFAMIAGTDTTNLLSVQTSKPQMNGSINSLANKIAGIAGKPGIKDKKTRQECLQIPYAICNDKEIAAQPDSDGDCWNGHDRAKYVAEVQKDGLISQLNNPEVVVDPNTSPDIIRQQKTQLRIITSKLNNAFHGEEVEWIDTVVSVGYDAYPEGSGVTQEGSGDITDDTEGSWSGSGSGDGSDGDDERIYTHNPNRGRGNKTKIGMRKKIIVLILWIQPMKWMVLKMKEHMAKQDHQ